METTEGTTEQEIQMLITVGADGDPKLTTSHQLPIPLVLGFLNLVQARLASVYYASVLQEKQKEQAQEDLKRPQIIVPELNFSSRKR